MTPTSAELQKEVNKLQGELVNAIGLIPNPLIRALAGQTIGRLHFILSSLIQQRGLGLE